MLLADLHAVAPAPVSEGLFGGWLVLAVLLAALVLAGVILTARR